MKRGRSALVVRTWRLLLALESRQRHGLSLQEAIEISGGDVCERTVRRDLEALAEVFPVEPYQGKSRYRLNLECFQGGRQSKRNPKNGVRRLVASRGSCSTTRRQNGNGNYSNSRLGNERRGANELHY